MNIKTAYIKVKTDRGKIPHSKDMFAAASWVFIRVCEKKNKHYNLKVMSQNRKKFLSFCILCESWIHTQVMKILSSKSKNFMWKFHALFISVGFLVSNLYFFGIYRKYFSLMPTNPQGAIHENHLTQNWFHDNVCT